MGKEENLIHCTRRTTQFLETGELSHCLRDFLNKKKATYFAYVGDRLDCFKTAS